MFIWLCSGGSFDTKKICKNWLSKPWIDPEYSDYGFLFQHLKPQQIKCQSYLSTTVCCMGKLSNVSKHFLAPWVFYPNISLIHLKSCNSQTCLTCYSVLAGTQEILRIFATSFSWLLRSPNVVLVLKHGESNAMGSALKVPWTPKIVFDFMV